MKKWHRPSVETLSKEELDDILLASACSSYDACNIEFFCGVEFLGV